MRVHAGTDPVTGRRSDLVEMLRTSAEADRALRLLRQVAEKRTPNTNAARE